MVYTHMRRDGRETGDIGSSSLLLRLEGEGTSPRQLLERLARHSKGTQPKDTQDTRGDALKLGLAKRRRS